MLRVKVFISGMIETYNIQMNKYEKVKNIKDIICKNLSLDPEKIIISFNNKNIEENSFLQNETLLNFIGHNKMPYFKVYFNEKEDKPIGNGSFYFFY